MSTSNQVPPKRRFLVASRMMVSLGSNAMSLVTRFMMQHLVMRTTPSSGVLLWEGFLIKMRLSQTLQSLIDTFLSSDSIGSTLSTFSSCLSLMYLELQLHWQLRLLGSHLFVGTFLIRVQLMHLYLWLRTSRPSVEDRDSREVFL